MSRLFHFGFQLQNCCERPFLAIKNTENSNISGQLHGDTISSVQLLTFPSNCIPNGSGLEALLLVAKDYNCKIDVAGTALCQICTSTIDYNKSGLKELTHHLKSKKHLEKLTTLVHTQRLPGLSDANPESMYGAPSVSYGESTPLSSSFSVQKPSIHLLYCVADMEAMVVGFGKLLALAKELRKDEAA